MQSLTQITRHDCVEGWSAIGKWRGVPLASACSQWCTPAPARVTSSFIAWIRRATEPYYESLDMMQAAHPQTLLALDLNDKPLDADHGAPVRLRVPTQLGYKSAKWVGRIESPAARQNLSAAKAATGKPRLRVVRRYLTGDVRG